MRATRHCSDPRGRVLTRQRADSVPAVSGRRLHLSTRKNSVGNPVLIHVRRSRVTCTSLRRSRIRHATHARGRRCRCSPRLTRPQSSCDLAAIARVHIGRDPRGIGVRTADGVITNRDHADVDDRLLGRGSGGADSPTVSICSAARARWLDAVGAAHLWAGCSLARSSDSDCPAHPGLKTDCNCPDDTRRPPGPVEPGEIPTAARAQHHTVQKNQRGALMRPPTR
jgi:hypothetical protein